MGIIEIKGKKIFAGPGTSWIAEALVEEKGSQKFVTVHYFSEEAYIVSEQSVYDFFEKDDIEPVENLEEYMSYEDAKQSDYNRVFNVLRNVIDMLD